MLNCLREHKLISISTILLSYLGNAILLEGVHGKADGNQILQTLQTKVSYSFMYLKTLFEKGSFLVNVSN